MTKVRLQFAIALVCACCIPAGAQTTLGTITGILTDASGAVVPNTTVVAKNVATGVAASTASSATGNYVLLNLSVGTYELRVSAPGFKEWTRSGIVLSSNQTVRVDVPLEIGMATESVVVKGEAPALRTESTEVSATMEGKLVRDLPIPSSGVGGGMRNAFTLMMMMPQVITAGAESGNHEELRFGGGQAYDYGISVDGLSIEIGWRNFTPYQNKLVPVVESIAEFRVETATFKAEFGRSSGGMMTIVTRSGTNQLHGSLFDYYRSQQLFANTWRNNKLGQGKSITHRNDYGFNASGPVRLPRIYDGRNRDFFQFSYEGYREPRTSTAGEQTIPLAAMKTGDFSGWRKANGALIPIYDPRSARIDASGNYVRDVFPGNLIPEDRISPIARRILQYFPDPNRPGLLRNYISPGQTRSKPMQGATVLKLDHVFGSKNRLAFTWTHNSTRTWYGYTNDLLNPLNYSGLPYPLTGRASTENAGHNAHVWRLTDTHMVSPTMVNTLVLGFHRFHSKESGLSSDPPGKNWGEKLGMPKSPYYNSGFPSLMFSTDNYTSFETVELYDEWSQAYGIDESLSWVRGAHVFKFGYNGEILQFNQDRTPHQGRFTFHRLETARPADNTGNSGSSFASFMLGAADQAYFRTGTVTLRTWPSHSFFAQDDWKITPHLTANIGFRFEFHQPMTERLDRIAYLDATLPNPAADGFPGAFRFLGTGPGREGKRAFYDTAKGYGPRLGLAYQLTSKTVVRAGAGIYYSPNRTLVGQFWNTPGFTAQPLFVSPNQGVTPALYWDRGWPAWTPPPNLVPSVNVGQDATWYFANDMSTLATNNTWSFAISRTLPRALVVDLTYTGAKGTRLPNPLTNYMQIEPKYAYLGGLLNKPIDDPQVVALGFKRPFPSFKQLMGDSATLGQSLRMFPQYMSVDTVATSANRSGNSTYHALLVEVRKRFSDGLSVMATYTWSKALTDSNSGEASLSSVAGGTGAGGGVAQNHYNRRLEKSYSSIDIPHVLKVTGSYDLPFGKQRPYLTSGIGSHLLGGWTLGSFFQAQSGFPLGVTDTAYPNYLWAGAPRPDILSHDWHAPTVGDRFDPDKDKVFNPSAFQRRTNPSIDPFGNAPRMIGKARWGSRVRQDVSVVRSFHVWESLRLEFRWEAYNLWNQKTWSNPATDMSSNQFGMVTNAEGNRTMQGALRLEF